jgi:hypothetical protein
MFATVVKARPLVATVAAPAAPSDDFHLGTSTAPDGSTIGIDSESLWLNGRRWCPVMGEFHYTRYPAAEWREELLKMKADGITIVSTYVFWIHHEEVEGQWDWQGNHDLHEFVRLAGEVGLKVIVRCGPWCHGEVRNGGFPDWLLAKGWNLRSVDPRYLGKVQLLYRQIAAQLDGELWKQGGPVIGIQLDNEYTGPADYLVALKALARGAGLDVPLYTRTGWTQVTTPLPFGEILPLYGAYAEGFWSRELTSMPGQFWSAFRFTQLRFDDNIATEQMGHHDVHDAPDVARYPYLTCEIGGGMMSSYHRRILVNPEDIVATTIVKLGSGSTLLGYYMFQGGINPEGKLTTLMEAQDTSYTNYNDLPERNYDFQAPLGAFGQIRPQYNELRRIHLFLGDFGSAFAAMGTAMPAIRPGAQGDISTLRWSVRSDGRAGYVFVNNYERSLEMPAKPGVQFSVQLPSATVTFPRDPITVPADQAFFWPFNFDVGHGRSLTYALAEPLCALESGDSRYVFFAATPGVRAEFAVDGEAAPRTAIPGRGVAFRLNGQDGHRVNVVLLSTADSLELWKGRVGNREYAFLTPAGLVLDGPTVRLTSEDREELSVSIFPAPTGVGPGAADGIFTRFRPPAPPVATVGVSLTQIRDAGPAREIPISKISEPEATEPSDADFTQAARWKVTVAEPIPIGVDPILRLSYAGDVARYLLDGRLLVDDFYNGRPFDLGLKRYAIALASGSLELAILPLRADALKGAKKRIFMAPSAWPDFGGAPDIARVNSLMVVPRYTVPLVLSAPVGR